MSSKSVPPGAGYFAFLCKYSGPKVPGPIRGRVILSLRRIRSSCAEHEKLDRSFVVPPQDDIQRVQDPKLTGRCTTRTLRFATPAALGPGRPFISRGCGLATDQKAVRTRGPGRVVLGSKPQLATAKKLVSWATPRATTEKLVNWAKWRVSRC